ncbi:PAS domain S-box protein [Nocardioides panacisoli]|uniref:histidine kinase n=1 Tax=Nocardioides panacisoli TaxID=627624 RepID=A0ABP7IC88_9ACTN
MAPDAHHGKTEPTDLPTVVIVDDAVEVRTLVRTRLRLSRKVTVVGEGSTGRDAIELAGRLRPDLMLLDVSMPGMDGLEALPKVRASSPDTRVAMYSGFEETGLADQTLELGAAAFFEKSTPLETLADDLLSLLPGEDRTVQLSAPDDRRAAAVEPVLKEHLERFREVFEDAAIGMATMTLSGRIVRANPSFGRLVARDADELVAESYADLAGEDAGLVGDALAKVVSGDRDVLQIEHRVVTRLGDRRLLSTISSVRDAAQRPVYLFLQVQDVSAQREVEEELRLSEQRFRLLVETVQDYAIFMLDPDGHIASWNAGAQRIKGWTADEIVGKHFRNFYPEEKQLERHPEHELELAIRDGHYEEEGWRVRKDGSTFWAQVTITAVRDATGELIGFAKVTRDITERRQWLLEQEQAARALAQANAALEEVNQQLSHAAEDQSQFLGVTAHELRSPVGVLGGSAELLRRHWPDLPDEERVELLDGMTSSAARLQRLLKDLLTASRIRSSSIELKQSDVDLAGALERIARSIGRARPGEDIELRVPPDLTVVADPDRFAQMVENLLDNALRHGAAPVVVEARPHHVTVDILVTDSGAGVTDAMRDRLFERFATSSEGGTGLGLYIVRALARAHGGDANYLPDDGAFVITLPLASAGATEKRTP